MEKEAPAKGNAIQRGALNTVKLRLALVQLRIAKMSSCSSRSAQHLREFLSQRMDQLIQRIQDNSEKRTLEKKTRTSDFIEKKEHIKSLSKTEMVEFVLIRQAIQDFDKPSGASEDDKDKLLKSQDALVETIREKLSDIEPHFIRAKKVRMYPTRKQKKILTKYMSDGRRVYNECVRKLIDGVSTSKIRDKAIRARCMDKTMEKTLRTPEHVRQKSVDQFVAAQKGVETRETGSLHFRSKFNQKQRIGLQKKDSRIHGSSVHLTFKEFDENILLGEELVSDDGLLTEIVRDRGVYYATVTKTTPVTPKSDGLRVVSLDMGSRKFGSFYSPDGSIGFIGEEAGEKLLRLIKKRECLKKLKASKSKLTKGWRKVSKRIANLVNEMHNKVALYLVRNYDIIMVGRLSNGVMKTKSHRNQKLLHASLKHYQFRQRLINKGNDHGKKVAIVPEQLTTKLCDRCGFINWKMKAEEVFTCPKCKHTCDRDIHSGRCIFIKNSV